MFNKTHDPLVVVVKGDRYDCYGNPTRQNIKLMALLKRRGGVSDSVPDGTYHFYIKRVGLLSWEMILEPAPK